jgi:formylmethanofuran dehydrogenase subunit E-like metal-binding protein
MNKCEFDKEIYQLIRKGIDLKKTKLYCIIWHESCGGEDIIYINTELIDNEYNALIKGIAYNEVDDLEDTESNLTLLKKEQKKIINKIKKWLGSNSEINIIAEEQCV